MSRRVVPWLERGHRWSYLLTLAAIPYWWHLVLLRGGHPGVFYFYDSVVLFASDCFLVATIAAWVAARLLSRRPLHRLWEPAGITLPLGVLALAALLSTPTSLDAPVSVYLTFHLVLLWLLVVYTLQERPPPGQVAWVFLLNSIVQVCFITAQLYTQSTFPLGTFFLGWQRELPAAQPGASVVETVAGARWLRAYGSFPHPNILGGYLSAASFLLAVLYLRARGSVVVAALALASTTTAGLLLAFSRAAWLGFLVGLAASALLLWSSRRKNGSFQRAAELLGVTLVVYLLLGAVFGDFLLTRLVDQRAPLEGRSTAERLILRDLTTELVAARPILGVGAGSFVLAQQQIASQPGPAEPVHSLPLLILVETGPLGALAWIAAMFYAVVTTLRFRQQAAGWFIGTTGALAALLVASFFDHYLWSLAPTRTLLWATWGLWAATAPRLPGSDDAPPSEPSVTRHRIS